MDIKLELNYKSSEIKKALRQYYLWSVKKHLILLLAVIGIVLLVVIMAESWEHLVLLIIGVPLIAMYFFLIQPSIFLSKNKMDQSPIRLDFGTDKVKIKSALNSASYSWKHFKYAFETEEFVLLGDAKEPLIIIPKRVLDINEIEWIWTKLNIEVV